MVCARSKGGTPIPPIRLFCSLIHKLITISLFFRPHPHSRRAQWRNPSALLPTFSEAFKSQITMAPQRSSRQSPSVSVAAAPRSSRHAKPAISYLDPSSDEDDEDEELGSEADYEAPPGRRRGTPPSRSAKRRRTASPSPARSDSPEVILYETRPKRRQPPAKHRAPLKGALKEKIKPKTDVDPYSAGIIPPWQTFPYHVLLQIFEYASYPLVDERTFQQTASWTWLLKASKLCRAFSEPALTVLYRSPCLTPMERAHTYVLPLLYRRDA